MENSIILTGCKSKPLMASNIQYIQSSSGMVKVEWNFKLF